MSGRSISCALPTADRNPPAPMRKPKGKLVALLAGAVVVVLVVVTATFWKDVYCHLFLDPRLVGRWRRDSKPMVLQFDRIGNVRAVEGELHTGTLYIDSRADFGIDPQREDRDFRGGRRRLKPPSLRDRLAPRPLRPCCGVSEAREPASTRCADEGSGSGNRRSCYPRREEK